MILVNYMLFYATVICLGALKLEMPSIYGISLTNAPNTNPTS